MQELTKWCHTAYVSSRWDDDVVFRNQARGTENKGKKEFVNVAFHHIRLFLIGVDLLDLGSLAFGLSQAIHGKCDSGRRLQKRDD